MNALIRSALMPGVMIYTIRRNCDLKFEGGVMIGLDHTSNVVGPLWVTSTIHKQWDGGEHVSCETSPSWGVIPEEEIFLTRESAEASL